MANYKLYYVSQSDFDAKIKNAKMPHQQNLIYKALADLGKPTRGQDVVEHAVKRFGLQTRQDYAVLAAWYFSEKRKPAAVTLGMPTVVDEDPEDRIARLELEIEAKSAELADAKAALEEMQAEAQKEEESEDTEAA